MVAGNLIHEGPEFVVYKEMRDELPAPVTIKQIKNKEAPAELLLQLKNELEQTHDLSIPGVRKAIRLEHINQRPSLLLEYVDGLTLKEAFLIKERSLNDFFLVAAKIAQAVSEIHQHQIIHKDLNSKNILVSQDLATVTIIDFGIATRFNLKSEYAINPDGLEGSLAYISPEQTGRMNRAVDSRSDLYSLGVILYELLTGRLPFEASDPAEYVYCHIARKPIPPAQLSSSIPEILSAAIMKLLEKNAENRYQSASGIKYDLEFMLLQAQEKGTIEEFELAQHDFTGRFQVSSRLYGRENEIQFLTNTFYKSLEGELQAIIVCGFSGIGKTSLIHEMHQAVTKAHGYFLEGKFGQFQRSTPYQAFIQAFNSYVKHFLTSDESLLAEWKHRLKESLGENLSLLLSLLPDLDLLFEEFPQSQHPIESSNRFNFSIIQFIKSIAAKDNPVVLFLDDVQWSDLASLDLLKEILTDTSIQYVTIIISYRDNEVLADHPLSVTLNEVREHNSRVRQVRLKGLAAADTAQLLSDTFNQSPAELQSLAEIVLNKTEGNPFFISEFLKALYAQDLIRWNASNSKWEWREEPIKEMSVTENVVHFLAQKIRRFPPDALKMLQYASCIGQKFSVHDLAGIMKMPVESVIKTLYLAIREGYIIPSAANRSIANGEETEALPFWEANFAHDRFLQAVHSMLGEEDRKAIHYSIGTWMLQRSRELSDIFELVNHLNEGWSLITSASEKSRLCQLNYEAGQKAKNSSAYEEALHYFQAAVSLLAKDEWEKNFSFAFQLSLARAEAEYLNLHVNEADQLFDGLMTRARSKLEKGYVYERKLSLAVALGKYKEALKLAHAALQLFNIRLPRTKAGKYFSILKNTILMKWRFRSVKPEDLLELPEIKNEKENLVTRIFSLAISPVYFSNDFEAYFSTFLSLVNYTIVRGNSVSSPHIFVTYAIIENVFFQNYQRAYAIGRVCLELNRRNFSSKVRGQLTSNLAGGIYHWVIPLRETFQEFYTGYKHSFEAGDYNYLAININQHIATQIRSGRNLKLILEEFEGYRTWIDKTGDSKMVWEFNLYMFCMRELMGKNDEAETASFEESFVRENQPVKFNLGYFYTARSRYYFIMNEYEKLWQMARTGIKLLLFFRASPSHADAVFYYSLSMVMNYHRFSSYEQQVVKRKLRKNIRQFEKWEQLCPQNFSSQLLLICSGYSKIENDITSAINYCQKAAIDAKENQFIQLEAIANEMMGNICLENNLQKESDQYLQKALLLYARWGAVAKVAQLKNKYPALRNVETREIVTTTFSGQLTRETARISSENIDLSSVMKASIAIAGEVKFDQLINKMMKIVIENAGAEEGSLILEKEGLQTDKLPPIENTGGINLFIGIPNEVNDAFALSLVHYVYRTKEEVVIDEAVNDFRFSKDPYLQKKKPLSVLCMPILHQNKFIGILYLENNLATGAFTHERLTLLRLLSGQIAVSINNSILYENLEQKVADRTEEIVRQKDIIEQERQQSEKLLLNILPEETAIELKRTGKAEPQRFEKVTVLFTDFVDFSKISEQLTPDVLLEALGFYFAAFDEIISQYDLEKIKTIGDSYMCAGGLPLPDERNIEKTVTAAIEMRDFVLKSKRERTASGKPCFDCRIGVHTGSVIAGIIGTKKFAYDIWGDTVNTAARMQQKGEANRINISGTTYELIKHSFECTHRGRIEAKNKGLVDMYFVEGRR